MKPERSECGEKTDATPARSLRIWRTLARIEPAAKQTIGLADGAEQRPAGDAGDGQIALERGGSAELIARGAEWRRSGWRRLALVPVKCRTRPCGPISTNERPLTLPPATALPPTTSRATSSLRLQRTEEANEQERAVAQ